MGIKTVLVWMAGALFIGLTAVFLAGHRQPPAASGKQAQLIFGYTDIPIVMAPEPGSQSASAGSAARLSDPQGENAAEAGSLIFTNVPDSPADARSGAPDMAAKLKRFAAAGLYPAVIMEPTDSGGPINFSEYKNGAYDSRLAAYFQELKAQGVSDKMMGLWVYFPEANLPEWGPVDQADFAPDVTRSVRLQKTYFPDSRAGILLDAESYPAGSTSYDDGRYVSLSPFISGIPRGLLDSFCLQGFPWVPPANVPDSASLNPAEFLNHSTAAAAAGQLGVRDIWLNTGTFKTMYADNPAQTVRFTPAQRQSILAGIIGQARSLQASGFSVTVNLFAEDKSAMAEAVDWSYPAPQDKAVLEGFRRQLASARLGYWVFPAED